MNAKEMFEELGYKQTVYSGFCIDYYDKVMVSNVKFIYDDKKIELYDYPTGRFRSSIKLLKAINKQIEDLRWDNDN